MGVQRVSRTCGGGAGVGLESLEGRRLMAATFSAADLAGSWRLVGMNGAGTIQFDAAGNVTGGSVTSDTGATSAPAGTYLVSSSGAVSTTSGGGLSGAMNESKNVIAMSATGGGANRLTLLVRSIPATYASTDLSGAWGLFTNGAATQAGTDNSGFGTMTFDSAGAGTGTYRGDEATPVTQLGLAYTLATTGAANVTVSGTDPYTGAMNAGKDVLALSPTNLKAKADAGSNRMLVLARRSGTYSNADLTGTWVVTFDGGSGSFTFSGAGKITGGTVTNAGGTYPVSGTYSVAPDGTFRANVSTRMPSGTSVTKFGGTIAAGRDVAVMDRPDAGASGVDDLAFMVKAGAVNHAPTLTRVQTLKTAEAGVPFTITFDQLKAAANEADIDGQAMSFLVDSVGSGGGTLTRNGETVTAGATTVGAGDTLVWTPASTAVGTVTAFSVKASDGSMTSATAVPVKVVTVGKPTVAIAAKGATSEAGKPGAFTVSRTGGNKAVALTVPYVVTGTATSGEDFTPLAGVVTFAPGKTTATIPLTATDDHVVEPSETVVLTLQPSDTQGYNLAGGREAAIVTIQDGSPTVSVAAKPRASEVKPTTSGRGQVMVKRAGGNLKTPLTVSYTVGGTATNGTDYQPLSGTVTFAAGKPTAVITILPTEDAEVEGDETIVLTLIADAGPSYRLNPTFSTATITLADATVG